MATEKQVLANRRNALRSTGPRTPEGKRAVAHNAVRHGILSGQVLLPEEDVEVLTQLQQSVLDSFKPEGEWETLLVDRIAQALWRLQRLGRVEAGLFASARHEIALQNARQEAQRYETTWAASQFGSRDMDREVITDKAAHHVALEKVREAERLRNGELPILARAFGAGGSTFSTLSRYEATIERGLYRALHALERAQAARSGVRVAPPLVADVDVAISRADDGALQGDVAIEITKQSQSTEG